MHYDPIKQFLGKIFNRHPFGRKLFYRLLDILLLRTWHIHKALRAFRKAQGTGPDVRVLDAGSGLGQYSWYLARKNPQWQVLGVDVKSEEIASCEAFAKKEGLRNLRFEVQDLTSYRQPKAFDLILSVDVMEHIEEDETVFAHFHESLKPGGMLLISTPSDQGGSDVHEDGDASFIEEHVRDGYAASEIREKLARAGFSEIQTAYSYGKPGSVAWRISMKYPILMLGRSRLFLALLPFYYLITGLPVLFLNYLDVRLRHSRGTGLIVKAFKNHR